jgi:hypothetical protein
MNRKQRKSAVSDKHTKNTEKACKERERNFFELLLKSQKNRLTRHIPSLGI